MPDLSVERALQVALIEDSEELMRLQEAIEALHFHCCEGVCQHCAYDWPCPTIRLLNRGSA